MNVRIQHMSFWIQNMQINQNISKIEVIEHWHCTLKRTLRQNSDSLTYRAGSLHLLLPYVTICYHIRGISYDLGYHPGRLLTTICIECSILGNMFSSFHDFPYFWRWHHQAALVLFVFFHEDEYIITVNPNLTMYKVPAVQPVFQSWKPESTSSHSINLQCKPWLRYFDHLW